MGKAPNDAARRKAAAAIREVIGKLSGDKTTDPDGKTPTVKPKSGTKKRKPRKPKKGQT